MTGPGGDRPTRVRWPLLFPGAAGAVGAGCVVVGASRPGSPFTVQAAGAWFFSDPERPVPVGVGARFLGIMLVYVGIAVLLAAWFEVWRGVRRRPGTPVRPLVAVLGAWALPVVVGPPLFSRDVYSYAAQGQMVTRGISPYVHGPSALGHGAFLDLVDPLWRHAPAPYGPAWERLSGWIVDLAGHNVLASVIGFRVVAGAGVGLVALSVPVLARSAGRDPSAAFALAVLNPLVLLVLLGGSHNDALMLGLLVAGCAVARRGHVVTGVVVCALAAEVKIPALLGVVYIGWWAAGGGADARRRAVVVGGAVGLAAAVMAAVAGVSGLGWRWVSGLSNPGQIVSRLDPATGVGLLLAHVAGALGAGGHQTGFVDGVRIAAVAAAGLLSVRLLLRSQSGGGGADGLRALGWSLLLVVLLGPVVWPWYETWGLVVLAVVADGWIVAVVVGLSVVGCLADVPRPGLLVDGDPVTVTVAWMLVAVGVGLYLRARLTGPAVGTDPPVRWRRRVAAAADGQRRPGGRE